MPMVAMDSNKGEKTIQKKNITCLCIAPVMWMLGCLIWFKMVTLTLFCHCSLLDRSAFMWLRIRSARIVKSSVFFFLMYCSFGTLSLTEVTFTPQLHMYNITSYVAVSMQIGLPGLRVFFFLFEFFPWNSRTVTWIVKCYQILHRQSSRLQMDELSILGEFPFNDVHLARPVFSAC